MAVRWWHLPACIRNKDANPVLYELEKSRPQDDACKVCRASAHVCEVLSQRCTRTRLYYLGET